MRPWARSLVAALALVASASCVGDPGPEVPLDLTRACPTLDARVVEEDLLVNTVVRELVGDRPSAALGWAVVTDGNTEFLQRLPLTPNTPRVDLETLPGTLTTLIPSPRDDETWMLIDGPERLEIWRLSPDEIIKSGQLAPHPHIPDTTWERRIIFIDQQPHMFASSRASDDLTFDIWLSPINDALEITAGYSFEYEIPCSSDPQICALLVYSRIHILDVAEPNGSADAYVLMEIMKDTSEDLGDLATRSLFVATLRFSRAPATLVPELIVRTNYPLLTWKNFSSEYDVRVWPGEIEADATGFYILAGLDRLDLDNPEDNLDPLQLIHRDLLSGNDLGLGVPRETRPHLLQVEGSMFLGWLTEGVWWITRLDGDIDGREATPFDIGAPEGSIITSGGRGHYLHQRPSSGAQQLALTCP